MNKIRIINLFLLITFSIFSQTKQTKTNDDKLRKNNIVWISKQINTYGHASNLFYLGKFGAYWACHQIDVKSDTDQIAAKYKRRSLDSMPSRPEIILYKEITYVSTDDKSIPVINLTDKQGKSFTLILDIAKRPVLKKQLINAFNKLAEQNKNGN